MVYIFRLNEIREGRRKLKIGNSWFPLSLIMMGIELNLKRKIQPANYANTKSNRKDT